jgi:hypothetical protein
MLCEIVCAARAPQGHKSLITSNRLNPEADDNRSIVRACRVEIVPPSTFRAFFVMVVGSILVS